MAGGESAKTNAPTFSHPQSKKTPSFKSIINSIRITLRGFIMPPRNQLPNAAQVDKTLKKHLASPRSKTRYSEEKDALVTQERRDTWLSEASSKATRIENQAASIIFNIREHERDEFFGDKASEQIPAASTRDMGGQFLTNKSRIEKSKLFRIARQMPKGAHLHIHFNTEISAERLLARTQALGQQSDDRLALFIRTSRPLRKDQDYRDTEVVFEVLNKNTPEADPFAANYDPTPSRSSGRTAFQRWDKFCQGYRQSHCQAASPTKCTDDYCPHPTAWALSKLVVSEDEVYGQHQTLNGIWARFNQATRGFKGLLNYESGLRIYVGECIDNMIQDRIIYAELRPMLMNTSIPADDGERQLEHFEQMDIIVNALNNKKEDLANEGKLDRFPFGFKIIYCTPRSIPKEKMATELEMCLKLKVRFPNLICGFDLVGAEDRPNAIGFYQEELLAFTRACKDLGVEIPFIFHAGESLIDTGGSKDSANSNLYDALLLNSKRIGHGISLLRHPVLLQKFKEKNICIELCPISNEILHLCRNIKEHPYPQLLAAGLPCTVNSDNPVLFSSSLSHEFYQVMVGSFSMDLHGWRQLAEWSIEYSCLSHEEKSEATKIFAKDWKAFCYWIVQEYPDFR